MSASGPRTMEQDSAPRSSAEAPSAATGVPVERLRRSRSLKPNWEARRRNWFTDQTHSNPRTTRILKSLTSPGCDGRLGRGWTALEELRTDPDCSVGETAYRYWRAALPA